MNYTSMEIHSQYEALARTVAEMHMQAGPIRTLRGFSRLVVVGCGSSYMIGKSVAAKAFCELSVPVMAVPAGDLWLNADDYAPAMEGALLLALSRSGETSEVIRAVEALRAKARIRLLSVTCVQDSALQGMSDACVCLPWAYDQSVCQTRCVTNLAAAGFLCVALLGGEERDGACFAAMREAARMGGGFMQENEPALQKIASAPWTNAVVLGDSALCGLAEEGALAFNEICQLPSVYQHVLDIRHGPMVLVGARTLVIAMCRANGPQERRLLGDLLAKGATVVACTPAPFDLPLSHQAITPDLPPEALSALYISVCQLLAYHKAFHTGANPDAPTGLDAWIKL